jgi:hypothetical protein
MAADDEGDGGRPAGSAGSSGSSGGTGSVFRRKIGGVPMWLIMLALLGIALAYSMWKKNKATASTSATTSTGTTAGTQTAQQTPPFIIQNYTSGGGQGPAGPAGPAGAAGAPGVGGGPAVLPITGGHPPVGPVVISVPPAAPPATPPPPPPAPAPPAAKASAAKYTVLPGDNLSSIAGKFGVPGGRSTGWQILWAFNTNLSNRQAAGVPPVRGSNPNLIYPGEVILIPS